MSNDRIKLIVALAILLAAGGLLWANLRGDSHVEDANARMFVCVKTGKTFRHHLAIGDVEPVMSPHSGERTGWMAEACYWTKDGKAKKTPTWVVERRRMGLEGPTICPDCGRTVVGHNPLPPKELMDAAE